MTELKDFVDKLLFDYDLIDVDNNNGNRVESALIDATTFHKHMGNFEISPKIRKFHYWRGFLIGAIVSGLIVFAIMANVVIYVAN